MVCVSPFFWGFFFSHIVDHKNEKTMHYVGNRRLTFKQIIQPSLSITPTVYDLCIPIYLGFFYFPILWTTKMRKQCTMLEIEDSLSDKLYS